MNKCYSWATMNVIAKCKVETSSMIKQCFKMFIVLCPHTQFDFFVRLFDHWDIRFVGISPNTNSIHFKTHVFAIRVQVRFGQLLSSCVISSIIISSLAFLLLMPVMKDPWWSCFWDTRWNCSHAKCLMRMPFSTTHSPDCVITWFISQ